MPRASGSISPWIWKWGLDKPTTADYLYRLLPALRTLAQVRPEQRQSVQMGRSLRWNLDQDLSIQVHEQLVKDVPMERKTAKAEALLQLAWSRINKVAWNRNLDDKDVQAAYQDAEQAAALAEIPLDKFIAEYTKAYSLLFSPSRDNRAILGHLTEEDGSMRSRATTNRSGIFLSEGLVEIRSRR